MPLKGPRKPGGANMTYPVPFATWHGRTAFVTGIAAADGASRGQFAVWAIGLPDGYVVSASRDLRLAAGTGRAGGGHPQPSRFPHGPSRQVTLSANDRVRPGGFPAFSCGHASVLRSSPQWQNHPAFCFFRNRLADTAAH